MSASELIPLDGPSLTNVAIAVAFGLIGLYISATTFASGPSTMLEAGLAAAGLGVFGVWTWAAYLEADRVDQLEGDR